MSHDNREPSLASLIERGAELKRALVDCALSPRCERHLEQFMLEVADPYQELSKGDAIGVIDRFTLQHRLPNGKTVLDQFLGSRPDLTTADREMLRGWRGPVEGNFGIRRKDLDALVLLNPIDDLEYRAYSNVGPAAFRQPLPAPTAPTSVARRYRLGPGQLQQPQEPGVLRRNSANCLATPLAPPNRRW